MSKKSFQRKFQKALCNFKDTKGDRAIKILVKINKNPEKYL